MDGPGVEHTSLCLGAGILVLLYLGGESADVNGEGWFFPLLSFDPLCHLRLFGFHFLARVLRKKERAIIDREENQNAVVREAGRTKRRALKSR